MAANIKNDEERKRRIELVGSFFEETGLPTRQIAEYFSKNQFKISNKTVSEYIKKYMKAHPDKTFVLKNKIQDNTEKSVDDKETRERIFKAALLSMDGHTIKEIAEILNSTPKTIERDLDRRLPLLCKGDETLEKLYTETKKNLHEHQVNELNKGRNNK